MDNKKEMLADYPSNRRTESKTTSEKKPEDKKLEKVVTGKVKKQKRGFRKKIAETLLEDDTKSVGGYVLYDILIPAAKDLISDIVGGGVEMLLFGERRNGNRSRGSFGRSGGTNRTGSVVNYSGISSANNRDRDRRELSRTARARHDFDEIVLETRGEAEEVLTHLGDLIVDYNQASVSDLYDLVGITGNFTDEKYGWVDLRGASVSRARGGGYLLNLPRTQPLD